MVLLLVLAIFWKHNIFTKFGLFERKMWCFYQFGYLKKNEIFPPILATLTILKNKLKGFVISIFGHETLNKQTKCWPKLTLFQ